MPKIKISRWLTCANCAQDFERKTRRGPAPRLCPTCNTPVIRRRLSTSAQDAPDVEPLQAPAVECAESLAGDGADPLATVQALVLDFACSSAVFWLLDVPGAAPRDRITAVDHAIEYLQRARAIYASEAP